MQDSTPEPQKRKSQQAELRERAIASQQQRQQEEQRQRQAEQRQYERERTKAIERTQSGNVSKTTTGVYEKGGAVVRETRGDYNTLQKLKKQQPGSAVVQTQSGEYVLIRSEGLNLAQESTLARINENIQQEGGQPYRPTESKLPSGGTKYSALIRDSVSTSEPVPPDSPSGPTGISFAELDPNRPIKYTAKVGEGTIIAEQEAPPQTRSVESINVLTSQRKMTEKEAELFWQYHPRELSKGISEGIYENQFIGQKGPDIIAYEKIGKKEESQVFPITYTTKEGKEIVTITGASEGAEYQIFGKSEPVKLIDVYAPPVQPAESPSKGIERVLKRAAEPFYAAAVETFVNPFIKTPKRYLGISEKEQAKETRDTFNYERIASVPPGPTPLQNVIETGSPLTGRGIQSDAPALALEVALVGGSGFGQISKIKNIKNVPTLIKNFLKKPEPPLAQTTRPFRQSVMRDIYEKDVILAGYKKEKLSLGVGAVKTPRKVYGKPETKPVPVEPDINYYPQRLPVSRFPKSYGLTKSGFDETKISLGTGLTKAPIRPQPFQSTRIDLGEGKTKIPGKDFTKESVSLGVGAVKTPRKVYGKPETKPVPVEPDINYYPQRLPVSRFPKSYGLTKSGFDETKISLGRGIGKFSKEGGTPVKRFTGAKPPSKPSPEVESKISKGLILLMEKQPEKKSFTSTKIALGTSDKILQIRGGKVISDTLTQRKTKSPSESFFVGPSSVRFSEQVIRYPPSSKPLSIKASLAGIIKEQKSPSKILTQETTLQSSRLKTTVKPSIITRPKTTVSIIPKLDQPEKQKERYSFPPLRPTRQTPKLDQPEKQRPKLIQELIEIPPPRPPRIIPKIPNLPKPKPKRKAKPTEPKSAFEWKGNVPEFKIEGVYKKYDIIYGEKRVAKLSRQERFGKPKRRTKRKEDILGFPQTKKAKSNVLSF